MKSSGVLLVLSTCLVTVAIANFGCETVQCNTSDAILPNPFDCSSYCQCIAGSSAVNVRCPSGLHFNAELHACDWAAFSNCVPQPLPPANEPITDCEYVVCPTDKNINLANPSDCSSYCSCNSGVGTPMSCSSGLLFNAEFQFCDLPVFVNCIIPASTIKATPTSMAPTEISTMSTSSSGSEVVSACPGVTCPTTEVTNLPIPSDCTSYCSCNMGVGTLSTCTSELHFNAELQICDFPAFANCTVSTTTIKTTSTPTGSPAECDNSMCTLNTTAPYYIKSRTQCNVYCRCENGEATQFVCPDGYTFVEKLSRCMDLSSEACEDADTEDPEEEDPEDPEEEDPEDPEEEDPEDPEEEDPEDPEEEGPEENSLSNESA